MLEVFTYWGGGGGGGGRGGGGSGIKYEEEKISLKRASFLI